MSGGSEVRKRNRKVGRDKRMDTDEGNKIGSDKRLSGDFRASWTFKMYHMKHLQ